MRFRKQFLCCIILCLLPLSNCGNLYSDGHNDLTKIEMAGVAIKPETATVSVYGTTQLTATVTTEAAIKTVSWNSSDPLLATVDASGIVTGVKVGFVTITATSSADATKTATCAVTVNPPVVQTLIINYSSTTVMVSRSIQLTIVAVSPPNAIVQTVYWSSSDPSLATVDSSGLVTGIKVGMVRITVTANGAISFCTVRIY